MTTTTFTAFETTIDADWLNDVNDHTYNEQSVHHAAGTISTTPIAGITANNVQDALAQISALATGGSGGVTSLSAGPGIDISQPTGAITIGLDVTDIDNNALLDFTYLQRGGRNSMLDDLYTQRDWDASTGSLDPNGNWAAASWLGIPDMHPTNGRVAYWGITTSPFSAFRTFPRVIDVEVAIGYEDFDGDGDGVMVLGKLFDPPASQDTGVGWAGFMSKTTDTGGDYRTRVHANCRLQRANQSQHFLETAVQTQGQANPSNYLHRLTSSGNIQLDGSVLAGNADYAEMFEWSDGNGSDEDRIGMTVVIDGTDGKIRLSDVGDTADDIIGVVSAAPVVLGDEHPMHWQGRYERDAFGRPLMEDYEELTARGLVRVMDRMEERNVLIPEDQLATAFPGQTPTIVSQETKQRRVENPTYNPEQPYQSRMERPEWAAIGMMGKLRIRTGQITGPRWIKLRDIEAGVEEWLVR